MAFRDIEKIFYDGKVKISYLDKPHMYYARMRVDWDLPVEDKKAWGKASRPKGTTTLIEDTLEKKGLMTWPMGLALGELFGFYNFKNDKGDKMLGFSRGKGTLWGNGRTLALNQEELLPIVKSAAEAWQRKKQKGADIGSVVHDAIEHHITGVAFNMLDVYTSSVAMAEYETDTEKALAMQNITEDVKMAQLAFDQFKKWWAEQKPVLLGVEDLVYSLKYHVSGTFDGRLRMGGKNIIADWKTSNASKSKEAAAPEGVYYTYFIQSAIYAMIWEEMTGEKTDDLLIVSCRKDGGFTAMLASEVGLTVDDCIEWAQAVISAYKFREKTRRELNKRGELLNGK
jgi:hypothetical protein